MLLNLKHYLAYSFCLEDLENPQNIQPRGSVYSVNNG